MDEHIDSLIARRLSGECSPAEDAELNAWIAASSDHAAYFQEMEAAWRALDDVVSGPQFNTAAAWEQVAPRLQPAAPQIANGKPKPNTVAFTGWIKYATAAAAVLIIAVLFLQPDAREIHVLAANSDELVRLPDNSTVRLRKGSSIHYPEHFTANERRILLEGEAFFDVSKREEQRFVVDAGSISVTVLGTSFNVKSGPEAADVSVATGRVQLVARAHAGKKILLRAGRAAHFGNGAFTEAPATGNDTAWMQQELSYSETPLRQIFKDLAADADTAINVDASVPAELLDSPVQVRFKKSLPLGERLRLVCAITGLEYQRLANGYHIRKPRS